MTNEERRICELQAGFASRLRNSQYYIVERVKSDGESWRLRVLHGLTSNYQIFQDTPINIAHLQRCSLRCSETNCTNRFSLRRFLRITLTLGGRRKVSTCDHLQTIYTQIIATGKLASGKRVNLDELAGEANDDPVCILVLIS